MRISDWSSDVCSSDLRGRAPCEHAGDLRAVFDGAALVVDRLAGGARRRVELAERRLVQRVADQPLRGGRHHDGGDRNSDVSGKSGSVRVDLGGRRIIQKNKIENKQKTYTRNQP